MFSSDKEAQARLQKELDASSSVIDVLHGAVTAFRTNFESLLEAHTALVKAHDELLRQKAEQTPPAMWANVPLHVPEYEEDAQWALDNNLVDKKLYQDILDAAGFENSEIEFDEG